MGAIRSYTVSSVHAWTKEVYNVTPKDDPSNLLYKFQVKCLITKQPTMMWYTGDDGKEINDSTSKVVGRVDGECWGKPIHISLGNPELSDSMQLTLPFDSKFLDGTYHTELETDEEKETLDGAPAKDLRLRWKRTKAKDVKGFIKKMNNGLHMKLIDETDGRILARYINTTKSSLITGTLEIWEDVDFKDWDLLVMMSTLSQVNQAIKLVTIAVIASS